MTNNPLETGHGPLIDPRLAELDKLIRAGLGDQRWTKSGAARKAKPEKQPAPPHPRTLKWRDVDCIPLCCGVAMRRKGFAYTRTKAMQRFSCRICKGTVCVELVRAGGE